MMKKINITFKEYDANHYIAFVKRESKNLFMDLGLCNFENEMEYWDMPTKLCEFEGEKGYLFSNQIDKEELNDEIERFLIHNAI